MRARSTRSDWLWFVLILVLIGGASGLAAKAVFRLTLQKLGGVWIAWATAYTGTSTYVQLATAAAAALSPIARTIASGAASQARRELDLWLRVYDPLGLVRDAIDKDEIEDSPLFVPVPP